LIATAMLALTASNALAYDVYEEWDCGNDVIVTTWKDQLHFYTHEDHKYFRSITHIKDAGKTTLKRKGNAAVRIEWDFTDHPFRITVNDKACHNMSDVDWNKEECKKIPTLLICKKSVTASHVRMRHDRPCDIAQDKADPVKLNSPGGNAIRFGLCAGIEDSPAGYSSNGGFWASFNCGYQAYRQRKAVGDNPYLNENKKDGWSRGWQAAKKACTTGRRPFYPYSPEAEAKWYNAFYCGSQAYQQGKASNANPYLNEDVEEGWDEGWKVAEKACITGQCPPDPPDPPACRKLKVKR